MKFGGTSVGSPEGMKALIPLINDDEKKIVVLSAMAGTTNSLVEIAELLYAGNNDASSVKIDNLKSKYQLVVDELFVTDNFKKSGHDLIDSHFGNIKNFTAGAFTKIQEKAILAQGELISTALFNLLLQERNINSFLLPALSFMRIDKDGEPDSFYIEENIERELKNCPSVNIIITQGFICRNAHGRSIILKGVEAILLLLLSELPSIHRKFRYGPILMGFIIMIPGLLRIQKLSGNYHLMKQRSLPISAQKFSSVERKSCQGKEYSCKA